MAEVWCGSCGWSGPWGWPAELGSAQEAPALGRRRGWQGADARRRWLGLALNRCGRLARPRALLPRALLLHWAPAEGSPARASRGVEAVVAHALGCLAVDPLVGAVERSRTPGQCFLLWQG